jgi:hypothetical protein
MPAPWPCSACGAPGVKNLGRRGYCIRHLCAFVAKLPLKTFGGVGVGVPTPSDAELLACNLCSATWYGPALEHCPWCERAVETMLDDHRKRLLHPDWAESQGDRYDELSPVDKAVWDRTRGISRGAGSVEAWTKRLLEAVDADIITVDEARQALERARRE